MTEAMTLNKHHLTPAEVIAMRDELSAVIEESRLTEPVEIADMLIGSQTG